MLQATVSEGLTHGPYVAAGVGFEPATFLMQGIELTIPFMWNQFQHLAQHPHENHEMKWTSTIDGPRV